MFRLQIDGEVELRLLGQDHAEDLFTLVDRNRAYLREWLPWLDDNTTVEHSRAFINSSLEQVARNDGFQAGIWYRGRLGGLIGYHGIGTTLFYHLLQRMQQRGHRWAVADTGSMLQEAVQMYGRLGFEIPRRLWAWVLEMP